MVLNNTIKRFITPFHQRRWGAAFCFFSIGRGQGLHWERKKVGGGQGFGSGVFLQDPDPVFKFLCIRILDAKVYRNCSKSYLLGNNLKIMRKGR